MEQSLRTGGNGGVVVVGVVVVVMMMRVLGCTLQITNWQLQVVSIQVMTMLSSPKALVWMMVQKIWKEMNSMKVHIMLKKVVPHWRILIFDCMRVTVALMTSM